MSQCGPNCPCGKYEPALTFGTVGLCAAAQEAFDRDFPPRDDSSISLVALLSRAHGDGYRTLESLTSCAAGAITASTLINSGKPNAHAAFLGWLDKAMRQPAP